MVAAHEESEINAASGRPRPALPLPLALSLKLRLWRNRQIARPGFRRLIARLPLLRGIANRNAAGLFSLMSGFVHSQILLASVRLGLYAALLERPADTATLARHLGLPVEHARLLLTVNADLGLTIEAAPDLWALGDAGVVLASDRGLSAMVLHHDMFYRDLLEPEQLLAGTGGEAALGRYWAYARSADPGALPPEAVAAYSTLMRESQAMMAACLLDAHDFGVYRQVLDVGGGEGAFLIAAGRRHAALRLSLFDLPAVAERGAERLQAGGLASRSSTSGGDFARDLLPADADCVTLIRILCDHDDQRVGAILANLHRSLQPGTRLVIAEAMRGAEAGARLSSAYFGLYFLAMGSGRCRSPAEISALLATAGFRDIREIASPNRLIAGIFTAIR
ncbi:hydroxyneurosporene-O-methyltransferase [Rhizobium sp. RU20A]|uniref:methyltransferase n=1 Tax=Rhizobium sp. RU20A TaxID=1907412 RepID=UPI0009568AB9|nr:methyltransferase [Rhizobium sp. RU20A]SIR42577.1 hydroxyneurosporene-O-methyltransferase [Rhizobium sp. RU20A]